MRDLEIRGAGNLLGAAQHGHIAAVGFDLYSKLLAEAVRELKGDPAPARVDPVISVDVEALLPESYVPEVNQRLALYKRLAEIERAEEIVDARAELTDRFGPPPPAVEALLEVVALRVAARALGVERVEAGGGRAVLTFTASTQVTPERVLQAIAASRGALALRREYTVEARIPAEPWPAVRDALARLLDSLR
jgi:transcription-repair coupling factor (superfamily II helicase)